MPGRGKWAATSNADRKRPVVRFTLKPRTVEMLDELVGAEVGASRSAVVETAVRKVHATYTKTKRKEGDKEMNQATERDTENAGMEGIAALRSLLLSLAADIESQPNGGHILTGEIVGLLRRAATFEFLSFARVLLEAAHALMRVDAGDTEPIVSLILRTDALIRATGNDIRATGNERVLGAEPTSRFERIAT